MSQGKQKLYILFYSPPPPSSNSFYYYYLILLFLQNTGSLSCTSTSETPGSHKMQILGPFHQDLLNLELYKWGPAMQCNQSGGSDAYKASEPNLNQSNMELIVWSHIMFFFFPSLSISDGKSVYHTFPLEFSLQQNKVYIQDGLGRTLQETWKSPVLFYKFNFTPYSITGIC